MLKEIAKLSEKFENVEQVKDELKRIQSVKCRLKKQKNRADYEKEMTKIVKTEQALKEVREYFVPKTIPVTEMTKNDIEKLNFDETMKAIKSIQSKKCNSQWLENYEQIGSDYKKAVEIEKMLLEHKKNVKPIEQTVVKKSSINDLIHNLENLDENVSKEYLLEQLKKLSK